MNPPSAVFASILLTCLASAAGPAIEADVIYGRKDGMAMTMDVLRPAKPNGAGVIWLPTGGWYSRWVDAKISAAASKPLLDKGFTVFVVWHACAPTYAIPTCTEGARRSVRFIRSRAKEFGVDPERLGIWGGSAGGHLSLMIGTTGDVGFPKSKDPVLRYPSRVAAVFALCPPTDISNWVTNPPAVIKRFTALKPALTFPAKLAPEYSPLLKVTARTAPTLLIHGDNDALVPISHSKTMLAALEKAKVPCKMITVKGAGHGFTPQQKSSIIVPAMVEWFEKHLAAKKPE